jgi:DDE family transposase/transposase-like protein
MKLSEKAISRVGDVFQRAELGDARLVRRAVGLAQALAEAPHLSLPKVWATAAELQAGYDFLRSPRTDFTDLMEPAQHFTREQALVEQSVLVLHDTTDIGCPSASPEEVGFLQTGKAGFYVHHALGVSAKDRRPLGVVWSQLWGRPSRSLRGRKMTSSQLAKLDERESDRWLEGVTEAQLWLEGCTGVIHVMDREADSFRLYQHMESLGADFVVRMRNERALTEGHQLSEALSDAPIRLRRLVSLSAKAAKSIPRVTYKGRPAREAKLTARSARVELKVPNLLGKQAEPIEVNVVQVLEEHPPEGCPPIAWVLATTLPIKTKADVERVIDIYRARWTVEEFHKALKTGCMFEKRQLESFNSITTLLALCYPIACELLRVRCRARQTGIPAADVFRRSQLDCLRAHPKARKFSDTPTADEVLLVIAALGGHQKHNGPPGWESLAAGYMKLRDFERGWLAALASKDAING